MSRLALVLAALCLPALARAQLQADAAPPMTAACDDVDLPSLVAAIERELPALERSSETLALGGTSLRAADYAQRTLRPLLAFARANDLAHLCGALLYNYVWLRVSPGKLLITAYHTPMVRGSLQRDDIYRYPLYRRPRDASVRYTTAQILGGALANRGLELVWLADPYDALALHVEGAGVIELPDGARLQLGADGHNGQPYQNVSKLLLADNKLPSGPPPPTKQPGNPKARAYFTAHPADLNAYWGRNPHFVYFRRVDKAGGGKYGPLVNGRSAAVDAANVPLGALLFVRAQKPVLDGATVTGWAPFSRVMLAQDTGAGIRGARLDLFFGDDQYAQVAAQTMSVPGDAWVLMSKK